MSLTGSRVESYRFELLSRSGEYLGVLDGVKSGTIERNIFSDLRHGGSITLAPRQEIDWLDPRIRVTYLDGSDEYPLGTFIASSPKRSTDGAVETVNVELYSSLLILSQDILPESLTILAGETITEAAADLIIAAGVSGSSITPSAAVMRTDRQWEAGTSTLRVVNDLMEMLNYFSADVDGTGSIVASPYSPPSARAVVWTFAAGDASLHRPTLSAEADYYAIANRVVLIGSDATTEMVSVAEDEDSEVGHAIRGRWLTDFRSGIEAADQATLDALAARYLVSGRQVIETIELTHPYLPIGPNDVVAINDASLELDARYSIVGQRQKLMGTGAVVASTLRRVVA